MRQVMHELVTAATFDHVEVAYAWKAKLESEGIWSFVADTGIITYNWTYLNAVGGVKLQVSATDVKRANAIINDSRKPGHKPHEIYPTKLVYALWLLCNFLGPVFAFGLLLVALFPGKETDNAISLETVDAGPA